MRPLFRILGPLEVEGGGPLGGPQQRALLRRLLLSPNSVVSVDRLVDAVWGENPPERAREALQVYVSHLRKAVPDGAARIRWDQGGYRIAVEEDELDALLFERLVAEGRSQLAGGYASAAAATLENALSLWRGPAEGDGRDSPELTRLEELRLVAVEDRIDAVLALGRHRELVAELEALVAEEPLRERLRRQLMLALYRSGRQADALTAYQDARRTLVDELGLDPTPELRELEAAILRQDPALGVEPAELRERRRLPVPATPLVGRRQEVAQVSELLRGEARLVTLTGPGGTGKTRVAIQAAHDLAERFADGVTFVGLSALRDSELVLSEIGTALGVTDGGDPSEALASHLRRRSELLVIDNFEQVDEAAPALASLLGDAPGLKLLVTSRRPLRVYGEHEFPVAPLVLDEEAVPLFLERAAATGRPLQASEDVREICRRLDCLPLAIELAAARTRELTLAEMRSLLASRLELASRGPRDLPARQQTLRATIEWSYALLDEQEQRLFERLGVFAGGCTEDAAAEICAGDRDALTSLVERSLLVRDDGRFGMLETIREFAADRLGARGEAEAARRRHAEYFVELAVRAKPELKGADAVAWLDRLDPEHDNFRAGLEWSLEHEPDSFLRLVDALFRFWVTRGHDREGLAWYEKARALAASDPAAHAEVLKFGSAFAFRRSELSLARSFAEDALALYEQLGDRVNTARTHTLLGLIASHEGEHAGAVGRVEEGVRLAREADDHAVLLFALTNLAHVSLIAGDAERAYDASLEALEHCRELDGHEDELMAVYANLGLSALLQGRRDEAQARLADALSLALRLQAPLTLAEGFVGFAAIAARDGDVARAARLLGAADAVCETAEVRLEPVASALRDETAGAARSGLTAEEFAEAQEEGRALELREAAAVAVEGVARTD
jgi:predicted ATPase/DNA-binding SARP family transcriptional activator